MRPEAAWISAPRMEAAVDGFEPAAVNVGIDLGSGNIRMAQHELDGPQIGTMFEEVGGKGMAQGMGADLLVDPGRGDGLLDDLPEAEPGHRLGAASDEEKFAAPFFQ